MCMFCAAVPVTAAIGANLNNKQNATRRAAEEKGVEPPAKKPIAKITAGALIFLAWFGGVSRDFYSALRITLVLILHIIPRR